MGQTDIGVVVCTYNRAELLRCALRSLLCQETDGVFSYEVVVVDDASTDNTADVVKEIAARSGVAIRYVRKEGGGVAEARNAGVAEAHSRWIAFFDDDEWADASWLKNLLAVALEKGADCVGGICLLDLPQEHLSRFGPLCRGILGENIYGETPVRFRGKPLPPTGNLLIARGVFDSIGVFDTSMLYGGEDADLVARVQAAGFDIWTAPAAVVHHAVPRYRLSPDYFRWVSLRTGVNFALMNCRQVGCGRTMVLCVARMGQALFVNVPRLLLARLHRDKAEALDCECRLWRAVGYTRCTLRLFAPKMFAQGDFFRRIEFRSGRLSIGESQGSLREGKVDS
jgi:GT2 family glycosyltransferase